MAQLIVKEVPMDDEIGFILKNEIFNESCKKYVLVGEDETCLAEEYVKFAASIRDFEVRRSDIWVASYPKTGTTWTQEMVWMIVNNLDFVGAKVSQGLRFPFFEGSTIADTEMLDNIMGTTKSSDYFRNTVKFCMEQKSPRFLKTHLPVPLLPVQFFNGDTLPKIIYIWRNPKDVCVSYYHHGNLVQGWRTKLENFSKIFLADRAQYGSFWKHVLGYWNMRKFGNILFIKYEDMKADLPSVIKKVAHFLDKSLNDTQIELLCKHLSFESMKNNKSLNGDEFVKILKKHDMVFEDGSFIRSGTVGKYKEELAPEIIQEFDDWIRNSIRGTSLEQEYNYNI